MMLVALLLAAAGPASAQLFMMTREGLDGALSQYFAGTDRNQDGKLDRGEAAEALGVARSVLSQRRDGELFEIDVAPDGRPRLSLNEKGPLGQAGRFDLAFAHADRDGDGALSLAEVRAVARERFDAADRNGDGVLDKSESGAAGAQLRMLERMLGSGG